MTSLRVLAVASEIYPIVKTGGLADVAGALPAALRAHGIETRTLVPGYPDVIKALPAAEELLRLPHFPGGPVRVLGGSHGDLDLLVLDAPHLFTRPGNPYVTPDGKDWPDNGVRFAALSRMAAEIGRGAIPSFVPDVVHAHDWQAGLAPAYLHYANGPRPATVMTVHNLAYQGQFPRDMLDAFGLPPQSYTIHGVEYYGTISFLKAGLQFSDRITTVSPTYAREIQSDEGGMGLGGLLRERSGVLSGILNGIDISVWNPETDPHIATRFSAQALELRAANKLALQRRLGLDPSPNALLLGVVSRLSWQKGLDLLLENVPTILGEGMQLVLLGSGDADLQDRYQAAAKANASRIAVVIGYDEALAHLIQAGCGRPRGAVAFRAVRPDPALRLAIWRDPDRVAGRRACGHGHRRRRSRNRGQCGNRLQIWSGDGRRSRRRAPPGQWRVPGSADLARFAAQRHVDGRLLAQPGQPLCRAVP